MSSLPASWHGIGVRESKPTNQVVPLKRPRSIKFGPPITQSNVIKTSPGFGVLNHQTENVTSTSRPGGPPDRKTWMQRPKFDPNKHLKRTYGAGALSNASPQTPTPAKTKEINKNPIRPLQNPKMPTIENKPRAKSAGNSHELKVRTQEDTNMEILSLRKELARARDESTVLKGKLRRTEEECNKKIRNIDKQLAAAKKDCSGIEKKKESTDETLAALKQKCQKLEQDIKAKDLTIRKFESNSSKSASAVKTSPSLPNRSIPVRQTSSAPIPRSSPKTNQAASLELVRVKENMKKLEQENSNLKQKLKDKEQEIKTLKVQLGRAQKVPSALTRPTNALATTKTSSNQVKPTRVSQSFMHRTSSAAKKISSPAISNGIQPKNGKTLISEKKVDKVDVSTIKGKGKHRGNPETDVSSRAKEKAYELQRKYAARTIQREWRNHRERVRNSDSLRNNNLIQNGDNLIVYQAAEHVEFPDNPEYLGEHFDQGANNFHFERERMELLNFSQPNKNIDRSYNLDKNQLPFSDEE